MSEPAREDIKLLIELRIGLDTFLFNHTYDRPTNPFTAPDEVERVNAALKTQSYAEWVTRLVDYEVQRHGR